MQDDSAQEEGKKISSRMVSTLVCSKENLLYLFLKGKNQLGGGMFFLRFQTVSSFLQQNVTMSFRLRSIIAKGRKAAEPPAMNGLLFAYYIKNTAQTLLPGTCLAALCVSGNNSLVI